MEQSLTRIKSIRLDTEKQVNEHYKARVQLQDQLDDHSWQQDFCRGAVEASKHVEDFLSGGDPAQALLRLQNLRVETYCSLSERFKDMILLKADLERNNRELHFYRGVASTNGKEGEAGFKVKERCELDMVLKENIAVNDERVHYYRGMIAAMDEAERIVNEELNPRAIPAQVKTSPGVVGPSFEGQAMTKPDKIEFPDYATEYSLPHYPEFQPGKMTHEKLEEITGK